MAYYHIELVVLTEVITNVPQNFIRKIYINYFKTAKTDFGYSFVIIVTLVNFAFNYWSIATTC